MLTSVLNSDWGITRRSAKMHEKHKTAVFYNYLAVRLNSISRKSHDWAFSIYPVSKYAYLVMRFGELPELPFTQQEITKTPDTAGERGVNTVLQSTLRNIINWLRTSVSTLATLCSCEGTWTSKMLWKLYYWTKPSPKECYG